jgi:hypothetical protein
MKIKNIEPKSLESICDILNQSGFNASIKKNLFQTNVLAKGQKLDFLIRLKDSYIILTPMAKPLFRILFALVPGILLIALFFTIGIVPGGIIGGAIIGLIIGGGMALGDKVYASQPVNKSKLEKLVNLLSTSTSTVVNE